MIQLPYINYRAHLKIIMQMYDDYSALYNKEIEKKREEAEDNEERAKYQTLKATHRAMFKDLVQETGKRMLENIRVNEQLQQEQKNSGIINILKNSLIGDNYYICPTNRYQIAKHNKKELSTIYRNLKRLNEAGIILSTNKTGEKNKFSVFHGKNLDFELLINSKFLVVSDKLNPDYNPLSGTENEKTSPFLISPIFAFCKEEEREKEQLINKIYSDVPSDFNTTGSENLPTAGTLTRTEEVKLGQLEVSHTENEFKSTGGAVDIVMMRQKRGIGAFRMSKQINPDMWHAYHRLNNAAFFIDYMIEKIYMRRGMVIIPEARIKAIEYAEKHYFPNPSNTAERVDTVFKPCNTLEEYANRLAGLKWCIDAANRYAARKSAYFMLVNRYIDVKTENGFIKTLEWYRTAKMNEKEKARHNKNISDLRKLSELTRSVYEKQDLSAYYLAEKIVENSLNKYLWVFRRTMATVLNDIKLKNN